MLGVLAVCATSSPATGEGRPARPIVSAAEQPLRDLRVLRDPVPEVLQEALRDPYAKPDGGCAAARAENLRLDAELGPDIDVPRPPERRTQRLAAETVGSVTALPYRGLIRRVSGAAAQDEARSAAILAGMVRRGYLKGLLLACGG